MAQDKANDVDLRSACATALGNLGVKDKAVVESLLTMAQDLDNNVSLRRECVSALGNLGVKDKAVAILIDLYLAQPDKVEFDTCWIYNALWEQTVPKEGS